MKEVVAKKTLNALEREQTKLDALLAKRAKIVKAYEADLAEVDSVIKKQKEAISALREQEKAEKLNAIAALLNAKGVTVDALLEAAETGDLYGIQEKIEGKPAPSVPVAPAEESDTSDNATNDNANQAEPQRSYSNTGYNGI